MHDMHEHILYGAAFPPTATVTQKRRSLSLLYSGAPCLLNGVGYNTMHRVLMHHCSYLQHVNGALQIIATAEKTHSFFFIVFT